MNRREFLAAAAAGLAQPPAAPVADGPWLRPAKDRPAEPVWGHADGLAVGLWPTSGPRGLFRIYAPYLGQRRPRMVNFVSVEPVVKGTRGQSELEASPNDQKPGLRMWAADPDRGTVAADTLSVDVQVEPFRNGARPAVRVIFHADRPREVTFRVSAADGSARMDSCVLSATMGNYGRLRHLWLAREVADARRVWPRFDLDKLGFAPWRTWARDRLRKADGAVVVAATSDEADPTAAKYDPKVPPPWRYEGKPATHYWKAADAKGLVVRVNGRDTYWGGGGPIPGGVSFENFELEAPFAAGQEFTLGVTADGPDKLGFDPGLAKSPTDGR